MLAAGLGLGILFLYLALREVDLHSVGGTLTQAAWWPLIPFVVSLLVFYLLKAIRWRALISREYTFGFAALIPSMMMGFAGNNLLPFRLGEFIRVYTAGKQLGIPKTLVFATLVMERLLDLVALAVIVTSGVIIIMLGQSVFGNGVTLLSSAALTAGIALAAILILPWILRMEPERWLPRSLYRRFGIHLQRFLQGLRGLDSWQQLALQLANSIAQWALMCVCIHLSILAVGASSAPAVSAIVLGLIVFGISMPTSPAFIGTIEYAFVLGLGWFDIPADTAFAAAVYYHALSFLFVQTAGVVSWFVYRGKLKSNGSDQV